MYFTKSVASAPSGAQGGRNVDCLLLTASMPVIKVEHLNELPLTVKGNVL